ncbi:MAG: hypothetical protein OXN17_05035 [Candidatus Poribacteria bacterium]|nr:hypothetical protein [Candidatus Poribacteria bacterium]MDE0506854.1 hypothetical protein [Candidatus Poribacteria bacterium]
MRSHTSRIALAVLIGIIALGCASSPQDRRRYIAELPSSTETAKSLSVSNSVSNASSTSGQAKRVYTDLRERMWLDRLFRTKPLLQLKSLNELETILVKEYPRLTGGLRKQQNTENPDTALIPKNYNVAVITHCDVEVLKAFIDAGWWSLVLLESNPWLVVGYDDSGHIILEDPRGPNTNRKSESEFERLWLLPSRTQCVLIQLEKLDKYTVRRKLRGHLSPKKISKIHVRTPARPAILRKC